MIPAFLYQYIYIIIVAILSLGVLQHRRLLDQKESLINSVFLCVVLVLFIGFRPHTREFGDTINYASWWG